jgi:sugar phosphate isomerase/epimerase
MELARRIGDDAAMSDLPPIGINAVMLPDLDFGEQVELCQRTGITHYQIRPRVVPENQRDKPYAFWGNHKFDLTPARLLAEAAEIRKRLADAGLRPFGTAPVALVTDGVESLTLDFDGAAAVGAGRVRVNPPALPKGPFDYAELLDRTVELYGKAAELARPRGIKIVIETHARSLASGPALAWNICRHFEPRDVGVIFDLCNFAVEGNIQPNFAVAVLARHIDHVHIGGFQRHSTRADENGFRVVDIRSCDLDQSDLHMPTWLAALTAAGINVPLVVESFIDSLPTRERASSVVEAVRRALAAAHGDQKA